MDDIDICLNMDNIYICLDKEKFLMMSKEEFDMRIENAYINGMRRAYQIMTNAIKE